MGKIQFLFDSGVLSAFV